MRIPEGENRPRSIQYDEWNMVDQKAEIEIRIKP